jgi:hypothetical protein
MADIAYSNASPIAIPQRGLSMSTVSISRGSSFSAGWQKLYSCAILEVDTTKLPERISEARRAIYDRAEEILTTSSDDERRSLSSALRTLRIVEEVAQRKRSEREASRFAS